MYNLFIVGFIFYNNVMNFEKKLQCVGIRGKKFRYFLLYIEFEIAKK